MGQYQTKENGFITHLRERSSVIDLIGVVVLVLILLGIHSLPAVTRETLAFQVGSPSLLTAYTSHFVHLDGQHLVGNLLIFLPTICIAYVLCVLSDRRQLFRISTAVIIAVFPFVLSGLQLVFPRERTILGFSGLTAAFVGLSCFALTSFIRVNLWNGFHERYAPIFLFFTSGLIALIALPSRGYQLEIGVAALLLSLLYFAAGILNHGTPSASTIRSAIARPGYFEFTGAGVGLLVSYPFVAFHESVVHPKAVTDVYIHLLGFNLAFIIVFCFVFVIGLTDIEPPSQ